MADICDTTRRNEAVLTRLQKTLQIGWPRFNAGMQLNKYLQSAQSEPFTAKKCSFASAAPYLSIFLTFEELRNLGFGQSFGTCEQTIDNEKTVANSLFTLCPQQPRECRRAKRLTNKNF